MWKKIMACLINRKGEIKMNYSNCKECKCFDCATAKDSGGNCGHCDDCKGGECIIKECTANPGYEKIPEQEATPLSEIKAHRRSAVK